MAEGSNAAVVISESVVVPVEVMKMIVNFIAGRVVVGLVVSCFAVVEGDISVVEVGFKDVVVPDEVMKIIVNFIAGSIVVGIVISSFVVVEGDISVVEVGFKDVAEGSNAVVVIPESVVVPDEVIKMIVNFIAGSVVVGIVVS